jgi:tetratricopeptide (TPR) repeat protein
MQRFATWLAMLAGALLVPGMVSAADRLPASQSATILGPTNPWLSEGSQALEAGRFEEGVRLTLAGLELPTSAHDQAAGHSNICAGYAALKRWTDALEHCNRALELDNTNWRTYNNRAGRVRRAQDFDLA